ncbi:hypothetical protein K431DRAFT_236032, partial [Polychaeton citri CBS 116435]
QDEAQRRALALGIIKGSGAFMPILFPIAESRVASLHCFELHLNVSNKVKQSDN